MARGLGLPSSETATSLSLGARKRNVTLLSACTSGETSGGGGVWDRPAIDVSIKASKRKAVRFMVPRCAATLVAVPFLRAAPRDNTTDRASSHGGRAWKRRPSAIRSSDPAWSSVFEREPSFRTLCRGSQSARATELAPCSPPSRSPSRIALERWVLPCTFWHTPLDHSGPASPHT